MREANANPQRRGFLAGLLLACLPFCACHETGDLSTIDFYMAAFAELERHEFAALGLTLGVLCFAVVNAVLLVRSRRQAAEADSFFREQITSLTADIDRAQALLLSEPQIVVAWAAASDEPEIIGDIGIVSAAGEQQRVLAFGLWLPPDQALAMERAVEALRAKGESFAMALTTTRRPSGGGGRPRHRRARGHPPARRARIAQGAQRTESPASGHAGDMASLRRTDRFLALSGLDARRRWRAAIRQRRLHQSGRSQESSRRDRPRAGIARPRRAR